MIQEKQHTTTTRATGDYKRRKKNLFMKIDKKTYEKLTYKTTDIREGILALANADLTEDKAKGIVPPYTFRSKKRKKGKTTTPPLNTKNIFL